MMRTGFSATVLSARTGARCDGKGKGAGSHDGHVLPGCRPFQGFETRSGRSEPEPCPVQRWVPFVGITEGCGMKLVQIRDFLPWSSPAASLSAAQVGVSQPGSDQSIRACWSRNSAPRCFNALRRASRSRGSGQAFTSGLPVPGTPNWPRPGSELARGTHAGRPGFGPFFAPPSCPRRCCAREKFWMSGIAPVGGFRHVTARCRGPRRTLDISLAPRAPQQAKPTGHPLQADRPSRPDRGEWRGHPPAACLTASLWRTWKDEQPEARSAGLPWRCRSPGAGLIVE